MERDGLKSAPDVWKRTGISKAQINNLLNGTHSATLGTLRKLADGFKVPAWALVHPDGLRLCKDKDAARVLDYYFSSTPTGRLVILQVAQGQAMIED